MEVGSTGIVEGGAMGALTFIPVGGSIAAIGLDLVVMHALTTAVVTGAAHAYGIDPTTDAGREHLDRMLRKAWVTQAPKAATVKNAKNAFVMGQGRVNWSQRFRDDHRIAAAVEKLMKQLSNGQDVPIDKVVSKMPYVGLITAAGVNSTVRVDGQELDPIQPDDVPVQEARARAARKSELTRLSAHPTYTPVHVYRRQPSSTQGSHRRAPTWHGTGTGTGHSRRRSGPIWSSTVR